MTSRATQEPKLVVFCRQELTSAIISSVTVKPVRYLPARYDVLEPSSNLARAVCRSIGDTISFFDKTSFVRSRSSDEALSSRTWAEAVTGPELILASLLKVLLSARYITGSGPLPNMPATASLFAAFPYGRFWARTKLIQFRTRYRVSEEITRRLC
jgi:hypothetical protein